MTKHVVTWTPSICTGEDAAYEGTVSMRMPTYTERLRLETTGPVAAEGELDTEAGRTSHAMSMLEHIAAQAPRFVTEIAIRRKSDGFLFSDLDDALVDTDVGGVMIEITQRLRGKYSVGNVPPPS